jgi:gamma-glutamyltranspeptidase/glutathione hydrolase
MLFDAGMQRISWVVSGALLLCAGAFVPEPAASSEGPYFAKYAVAADNAEASRAGASILASGGNAADAAAATMLALGVASPSSSGLGGGGFVLYYRAADKSLSFVDFRERAPAAATPDMFKPRPGESAEDAAKRSEAGGLSIAVPGEPMGIERLVKDFGKLPLSKVVAPAEKLARDGYALSEHTVRIFGYVGAEFLAQPMPKRLYGAQPKAGQRIKNAALADAISRLGKQGAKVFYSGPIGQEIVRASKSSGGLITQQDLLAYEVKMRAPYEGDALGHHWASAPLPSAGGITMVSSLKLLERFLTSDAAWKSDERFHALIESWKGPYLDRQRYLGDPDHTDVPVAALTSSERTAARAARYHPALAMAPESYAVPLPDGKASSAVTPDNRGTSHFCVVDGEGNIASVTSTVNLGFGSRVPVHGFWLNDEMDDFASEVGTANAFGLAGGAPNLPGANKRPLSSMTPSIVFKDGKPVLCVGGSGGSRIITAVEQVALYVLKDGMHPQAATAAPRVHHQASPDEAAARDLTPSTKQALAARGHKLKDSQFLAHVQAIAIGEEGPKRLAPGCEPQKGGLPAGE